MALFKPVLFTVGLAVMLAANAAEQPNILLIVSDDQGYADLGFQGSTDIPTPNLDRLASEGVRFSNGYVTHPFCSPSRAALITGRYQQRFGHEQNPYYDPTDHREGLPTSEKLLPEFLRQAGYVTGWIGKWHLGAAPEFLPQARGFMETFGFIGGGHHYLNWKPIAGVESSLPILRNGEPIKVTNHLTLAFGNEAASFLRRHQAEPWFLYLAFNAPHGPLEPTLERVARFKSIANLRRRKYAAQVSLLDDAVGRVLDALRETGQTNRTLVFFFSDNGGPVSTNYWNSWNGSSNLPLRGGKGELYEGGVRVPFVVSWPGHLPAGAEYGLPVSSLDVFPTALSVAGVPLPTDRIYDGSNLIPFLTDSSTASPHDQLFWRLGAGSSFAARGGDAKLILKPGLADELYNLGSDIGETNNIADAQPNALQQLGTALQNWNQQMVPPAFPGVAGRARNPKDPGQALEP